MKSWNDKEGKSQVMDHYGLRKLDIFENSIDVGYWGSIKKSDLQANGLDQRFDKPIAIETKEQTNEKPSTNIDVGR